MKITKSQLKQIIKEELGSTIQEAGDPGRARDIAIDTLVHDYAGGKAGPAHSAYGGRQGEMTELLRDILMELKKLNARG